MKIMNSVEDDNESPFDSRRLASKYRKKYKSSSIKYKKSRVNRRHDNNSDESSIFILYRLIVHL